MRKIIKRVGALLASAVMLVGSSLAVCASDNGSYSFNYDYWGDVPLLTWGWKRTSQTPKACLRMTICSMSVTRVTTASWYWRRLKMQAFG